MDSEKNKDEKYPNGEGKTLKPLSGKREDYIRWDEYFMGIAYLSAQRSKDPNTQVGACIVSPTHKIMSVGYNGLPLGCDDNDFPWAREGGSAYDLKYSYVTHAEMNAILNFRGQSLEQGTIYVTLFPCNECAKAIIQSGIKKVIYASDKYANQDFTRAAKRMFDAAGVTYEAYQPTGRVIPIHL